MGIRHTLRHLTVTAYFALVGFSLPLHAQSGPEAGTQPLIESLREATEQDAPRHERELRAAWSRSGSASMDLLLRRGRDALEENDTLAAIEHFRALTDHAPDFAEGWHGLARAFFQNELFGPALDALGQTLALNPDHFPALYGLGVLFQQFDDNRRAEEAYRKVLSLHPHHKEAQEAVERLKREGFGRTL